MRLLLDECGDRRWAGHILGHDVRTVPQAGRAGIKNGELLSRAERHFDIFVTVDRPLPLLGHFHSVLRGARRGEASWVRP